MSEAQAAGAVVADAAAVEQRAKDAEAKLAERDRQLAELQTTHRGVVKDHQELMSLGLARPEVRAAIKSLRDKGVTEEDIAASIAEWPTRLTGDDDPPADPPPPVSKPADPPRPSGPNAVKPKMVTQDEAVRIVRAEQRREQVEAQYAAVNKELADVPENLRPYYGSLLFTKLADAVAPDDFGPRAASADQIAAAMAAVKKDFPVPGSTGNGGAATKGDLDAVRGMPAGGPGGARTITNATKIEWHKLKPDEHLAQATNLANAARAARGG